MLPQWRRKCAHGWALSPAGITPPSPGASVSCPNPSLPLPSTPAQARIVGLNSQYFLKNGGFFVISIKASCIDSTAPPEAVFAREVKKLQEQQLKPKEQVRPAVCVCLFALAPCCILPSRITPLLAGLAALLHLLVPALHRWPG